MVHMCKRIICPVASLHFFQILIFGVNSGSKKKKWPEITKNYVCPSTPYLSMHTSFDCVFLLCKFKMMTSPDVFFFFKKKFWFCGLLGGKGWGARGSKRQKIAQNDKKFCLTSYLRNCISYDCGFWYTWVK